MWTGGFAQSLARSVVVMTKAIAPSTGVSQSSNRKGSAIIREARYSSMPNGVRKTARSFRLAFRRPLIAIAPSCAFVVPYCHMWRRAHMANQEVGVALSYGTLNWS
jgi:hypothetical protein